MKQDEKLKVSMTFDEMAEVFAANYPWFIPNYTNVGRYARKLGYMKVKQMVNKQIIMKYVKQSC